jgi:hypothetical protein
MLATITFVVHRALLPRSAAYALRNRDRLLAALG